MIHLYAIHEDSKSDWHHLTAYFKLNSIVDGKGAPDGELKYWYDGTLIIDHTNVLMRTSANPDMKWNQFLMAPYIGDGSPADQSMWVDDLVITSDRPLADNDRDGMPDEWEIANGLNPNDAGDASNDSDGDRSSNFQEYTAGTDARSPTSVLRINGVTLDQNDALINFNSVTGKNYEIQRTGDLASGIWTGVGNKTGGNGGAAAFIDRGAASQSIGFYRLKLDE